MILTLEEIQTRQLEILKVFSEFCEEHGLRYYLAYGTLIGAARHKGFIPWDDDIDVMMPRPDYMNFLELTQNGLTKQYKVISNEYNNEYPLLFGKIYDNRTYLKEPRITKETMGLYIDVFPLDAVPNDERERKRLINRVKPLLYLHRLSIKTIPGNNWIVTIAKAIICPLARLVGYRRWLKLIQKEMDKNNWTEANVVAHYSTEIEKELIDRVMLDNIEKLEFEKGLYPVFCEYDLILRNYYGDYMQVPPEDERHIHGYEVTLLQS